MIKLAWYATASFAITALIGGVIGVAVALALFAAGAALMAATLVVAAGRSRKHNIDIGGLFFSQAPAQLKWALAAQAVIALATAPLRVTAAFGVLVPIFGLGLCGLWGARHGTYPPRET